MPQVDLPAPLPGDEYRKWFPMTWIQGSTMHAWSSDASVLEWIRAGAPPHDFKVILSCHLSFRVRNAAGPSIHCLDDVPWSMIASTMANKVMEYNHTLLTNSSAVFDHVPWPSKEWLSKCLLISPDGYNFFTLTENAVEEAMRQWDTGIIHNSEIIEGMGLMHIPHPSNFLP